MEQLVATWLLHDGVERGCMTRSSEPYASVARSKLLYHML